MTEDKKTGLIPHNCILEDCKRLSVSGVNEVGSFDESTIVAETDYGRLTVTGEGLHITKLSLEIGELCIEGAIVGINYSETVQKSVGFFARVFR